ncbi:MAG TPA: hypothetical protein VGG76_11110 [Gemmatimonadaceae bacterium]
MLHRVGIAALTAMVALPLAARSQQSAVATTGPVVNDLAPDFTLAGADRYGLLKTPVHLSEYRGRTVVLAFFYQARTKG